MMIRIHKYPAKGGIVLKGYLGKSLVHLIGKRVHVETETKDTFELHVSHSGDKGRLVSKNRTFTIETEKRDLLIKGDYILDEENSDEDVMHFDKRETV